MIASLQDDEKGFTLIEVIVTLTIAAVVGGMLYELLGTSMIKSSVPIGRLQASFTLQKVMENITADYPKNYAFDLSGLQVSIGAEGTNQGNYGNGTYTYTVVENHFIKFVSNQEQTGSATDNLLKVTLKDKNSSETLTKIFVQ